MLDLSAAFDTVDHSMLIEDRIGLLRIGSEVRDWFSSYLKDRCFKVKINDQHSEPIPVPRGVPQGSVGGPILFSIYTRRLSEILQSLAINHKLFADDTQGFHVIECFPEDVQRVVNTIMRCKKWLRRKLQKLNETKTKFMFVGKKSDLNTLEQLHDLSMIPVNGEHVEVEVLLKNLGNRYLVRPTSDNEESSDVCC